MHFSSAIWQWFLTVQTTGSLVRTQNDALIAIASVSAVVWTGGLIAWQIKAWTLSRNFALDMLQTAFMASIISLVAHPPTFRIVATFFLLYYGIGSIVGLAKNRNGDTWNKWFGKKYPNITTAEQRENVAKSNREYSAFTMGTMVYYAVAIVWPYPTVVAWLSALLIYNGYQKLNEHFSVAPDKPTLEAAIGILGLLMAQLNFQTLRSQKQPEPPSTLPGI